jgi:hypothetical protein
MEDCLHAQRAEVEATQLGYRYRKILFPARP